MLALLQMVVPTITSGTIFTGDTAPTWTQTFDTKDVGTEKTLTAIGYGSCGIMAIHTMLRLALRQVR